MTKQEFFILLNNLDNAGLREIDQLETILQEHSYFQVVPVLQAKIASAINSDSKTRYITKAALYTADRANLKHLIEDQVVLTQPSIEKKKDKILIPVEKEQLSETDIRKTVENIKGSPEPSHSDDIYKEVMKNLKTLKSLRKKFEFLEEKEQEDKKKSAAASKKQPRKTKKTTAARAKNKKELNDTTDVATEEVPEEKLHKINIDEQNSLIESFIKNESQFSKKKPDANIENKDDLSEKSTTISDEIISENLAEIMINQGKTEKAIEIYKKLIWKFPQKKAYFASRIEDLNNK